MKPTSGKALGAFALALLVALAPAPGWSQAASQPAPQEEEKFESKIVWGILIQFAISKISSFAFSSAAETFVKWVTPKLTGGTEGSSDPVQANLFRDSGAKIEPRDAGPQAFAGRPAATPAAVVVGEPDKPLRVDGDKENYQGVHVALMMAQDGGKSFVFRPVSGGFRTGERFKLRVVSTFGGEATIDNVNPRGERKQIYPPRADYVVKLRASAETLLPIGPEQFFEFTGASGREQLVINVADPRAIGGAASRNKVFRQDTKYGSNFVQEVEPDSYALVRQSIELVHAAH